MALFILLNESRAQLWASWDWLSLIFLVLIFITTTLVSYVVYNLYFHPLSKFPGPWYAVISDLFYAHTIISGHGTKTIRALHEKYGEVVRIAPSELSFSSATAWKDIYMQRKSGNIFIKDHKFYITDDALRAPHMVNTINVEDHAKAKKILSPAFSPKSLLEQEDIILKYTNMFMVAIAEKSSDGPLNLTDCYNWVTFDILGELAFGEPFGSVKERHTDEWIATILNMVSLIAWSSAIYRVSPMLEKTLEVLIPPKIRKAAVNHVMKSKAKILERMRKGEGERADFCSYIFRIKDEMGLNDWHMAAYSDSLIIAGSETSGTTLSALTYFLCKTPRVYEKLKKEVRSRYKSSSEITSLTATFPYLTAVIHEALRMYPPVPFGMPRIVPRGGDTVDELFIPGGTTVSVHPWASTRNERNFHDPDSFIPERWLDPESTDKLLASNPFSLGPRACIGQNMAWMELRILIANMVFFFDYELVDDTLDWVRDSTTYVLFEKPELWTKITRRDIT